MVGSPSSDFALSESDGWTARRARCRQSCRCDSLCWRFWRECGRTCRLIEDGVTVVEGCIYLTDVELRHVSRLQLVEEILIWEIGLRLLLVILFLV